MKKLVFILLLISSTAIAEEIDEMKTDLLFAESRVEFYYLLQERDPSEYHKLLLATSKEVVRLLGKVYEANKAVNLDPKKKIFTDLEKAKKEHIKLLKRSCEVKKMCVDAFGEGSIEEAERSAEVAGQKVYRLSKDLREN